MKKLLGLLLILALTTGLAACGTPDDGVTKLDDFIPGMEEAPLGVYADTTSLRFAGGNVYAQTTEDEKSQILEILLGTGMDAFTEYESRQAAAQELVSRVGENAVFSLGDVRYNFVIGDKEYRLAIADYPEAEAQMITILTTVPNCSDMEVLMEQNVERTWMAEGSVFDTKALEELSNGILRSHDDPAGCGTITNLATDESYTMWKWHTATVDNILEGCFTDLGALAEAPDGDFEYEVEAFGITWQVDTDEGYFSRTSGGTTEYGQMDEWANHVYMRLSSGANGHGE